MKGEYLHSIDAKGRLFIPAKFREKLGFGFVLTKGLENTLTIYPETEWEKFTEKISSLPTKQSLTLRRFFVASACDCAPDVQGRVLIPQVLRDYAELDKNVVVIGMGDHIEIWDEAKWKALDLTSDNVESIMEAAGI